MFRQLAWAVGSGSSGPRAAGTVGTKSTGGCNRPEWSPCTLSMVYLGQARTADIKTLLTLAFKQVQARNSRSLPYYTGF